MIPLCGLLNQCNMIIQFLLRWEGDTVHTLEAVIGGLAQPVGRGVLHNFEGLDSASHGDMGASTQVNQVTVLVGCNFPAIWNLSFYQLHFKWIVRE